VRGKGFSPALPHPPKTKEENAMEKQKIRLSIPVELLVKVYISKDKNESLDERFEKLLLIGLKEDGKL
jgi:hypothetical protein